MTKRKKIDGKKHGPATLGPKVLGPRLVEPKGDKNLLPYYYGKISKYYKDGGNVITGR